MFGPKVKSIDINEIKNLDKKMVIDVRTKQEYSMNKVSGVRNVEMSSLLKAPEKYLNKEETYYIMCASGMRSKKTTKQLMKMGYEVVNLKGGIASYRK